jgi:hypothetical protein
MIAAHDRRRTGGLPLTRAASYAIRVVLQPLLMFALLFVLAKLNVLLIDCCPATTLPLQTSIDDA